MQLREQQHQAFPHQRIALQLADQLGPVLYDFVQQDSCILVVEDYSILLSQPIHCVQRRISYYFYSLRIC